MTTEILPRIHGLSGKLLTLERRREFLTRQLTEGVGSRGALEFARSEQEALEAVVDALRYHRAIVNGLDNPLTVLRELVEALQDGRSATGAIHRAKQVLEEYEA